MTFVPSAVKVHHFGVSQKDQPYNLHEQKAADNQNKHLKAPVLPLGVNE